MSDYYKQVFLNPSNTKSAFFFENIQDLQRFSVEKIDSYPTGRGRNQYIARYNSSNILNEIEEKIRQQGQGWYGTTDTSWATQPINRFLRSQDLENDMNRLSQRLGRVDISDIDQKKKMEFTEMELGIFSFDLAALGLIRVYEYYSPLLKRIVNPDLVQSFTNDKGEDIFYYVGTPFIPRHQVPFDLRQGCYFSPILGRKVESNELEEVVPDNDNQAIEFFYPEQMEIPEHNVERRQQIDDDGNNKFASTYKKCFIHIPKVKGSLPRIDLLVPISYSYDETADQIYWNCISVLSICEKLNAAGINFRLIACIGIGSNNRKQSFVFCNLKNDNQNIDRNEIAIAISDARYSRASRFQTLVAAQVESGFERDIPNGLSLPIRDQDVLKRAYMEYLSMQTNESDREAAQNPQSKLVVAAALSERAAINSYQNIIQQVQGLITI